ncbi:hypothetical protein CRENBAI_024910, partial [Crenichthys baileyi]
SLPPLNGVTTCPPTTHPPPHLKTNMALTHPPPLPKPPSVVHDSRDCRARRVQGDRWHTPTSLPSLRSSPSSPPYCISPPARPTPLLRWRSGGPDQCHSVSLEPG